jgi:hypothetical protein
MALFHTILLEFVFIDQLSLVFSKPLTKKTHTDIPISLDLITIVLVAVVQVVDTAVESNKIYYIP